MICTALVIIAAYTFAVVLGAREVLSLIRNRKRNNDANTNRRG
jgi:hypothetical protein